jgi:hypothetical protein
MEITHSQPLWPHSEVFDLFYSEITEPMDRISALARALIAWSFAHEGSEIKIEDMNAVVVLAEYIENECKAVRALEHRVVAGPKTASRPPIDLAPGAPIATTAPP